MRIFAGSHLLELKNLIIQQQVAWVNILWGHNLWIGGF